MRRPSLAICLASLALAGPPEAILAGQQPRTFKSGVEIVVIDVNVIDQAHQPVGGLGPEDFVVTVDSKTRKVATAQFVQYDVHTTTVRENVVVSAPSAARQGAAPPDPRPSRNVLIVVDVDSMEPGDGTLVRQEAAKFVDNLAPDDRVGVVTIPRIPANIEMTRNREQVRAALGRINTGYERPRSGQYHIGTSEAFDAEDDTGALNRIIARECKGGDKVCQDELKGEVRWLRTQERLRGERSLEALRDLGVGLRQLDGPKTMILVSGGTPPPDRMSKTWYTRVAESLAAAQVSLYTLYIEQPDFQAKYRTSPTAGQDRLLNREGIETATSGSGGAFMDAIGTWDYFFDRVVTELSGAYMLGIEVEPSDRDGRAHNVSVKVKRAGINVRARTQYVIPASDK